MQFIQSLAPSSYKDAKIFQIYREAKESPGSPCGTSGKEHACHAGDIHDKGSITG